MDNHLIKIHLAVLLFGAAGLFGKLINLQPEVITFGRVFFAALALFLIMIIGKHRISLGMNDFPPLLILGFLLAVHWTVFFYSIRVSTVSIGLISFSTFPIFVLAMESAFKRNHVSMTEILLAFMIVIGSVLVIPEWNFSNSITLGFSIGLLASFTFALISVMNKRYVEKHGSVALTFYQMLFASVFLFPLLLIAREPISGGELWYLVFLGVVFTALSHTLFISGLKRISAYRASIITGLEPVYGVMLAYLILDEMPAVKTIFGGAIIIACAVYISRAKDNGGNQANA